MLPRQTKRMRIFFLEFNESDIFQYEYLHKDSITWIEKLCRRRTFLTSAFNPLCNITAFYFSLQSIYDF